MDYGASLTQRQIYFWMHLVYPGFVLLRFLTNNYSNVLGMALPILGVKEQLYEYSWSDLDMTKM